ncbi:putative OPT family small oligopeptide transporter [Rosellinia necatrix]|uniref:Putative OPT family small oligopeptide transporter n=1 Tax=Rosellinia necatrix TaxID=77044 RepID=A0A1S8AAJ3_ROSNE|nr:putative OPT family small oligopeptide transporter [Rosellinia necatrix]
MFRFRRRATDNEDITPEVSSSEGTEVPDTFKHFEHRRQYDPNLPTDEIELIEAARASNDAEKAVKVGVALTEDDSSYPEVYSLLPLMASKALPSVAQRSAPPYGTTISTYQPIRYGHGPSGCSCAQSVPPSTCSSPYETPPSPLQLMLSSWWHTPSALAGICSFLTVCLKFWALGLILSLAAYGGGVLYATDVLLAQQVFYHQHFGWGFQLLFGITTLCTGYGLAGLMRRFLVWPAAMIWPSDLVNATLLYTLHDDKTADPAKTNGWRISRHRWFLYIMAGGFCDTILRASG